MNRKLHPGYRRPARFLALLLVSALVFSSLRMEVFAEGDQSGTPQAESADTAGTDTTENEGTTGDTAPADADSGQPKDAQTGSAETTDDVPSAEDVTESAETGTDDPLLSEDASADTDTEAAIQAVVTEAEVLEMSAVKISRIPNQVYTGEAVVLRTDEETQTPGEGQRFAAYANGNPYYLSVTLEDRTFTAGVDYEIASYERNAQVGTAAVLLRGLNNTEATDIRLTGEVRVTFRIARVGIAASSLRVTDKDGAQTRTIPSQAYTGKPYLVEITPDMIEDEEDDAAEDADDSAQKEEEKDYRLVQRANPTGKEDGEDDLTVTLSYGGVTLRAGRDYTIEYEDNTEPGTATVRFRAVAGSGFTGTKTVTFKIREPEPVVGEEIRIEGVEPLTYTGRALTQTGLKLYDDAADGRELTEGVDYTVSYASNINVYTYTEEDAAFDAEAAPRLTVTMKGAYKGTRVLYFRILPQDIAGDVFTLEDLSATYTGEVLNPVPVLKKNGAALTYGTDYYVEEYADGEVFSGAEDGRGNETYTLTVSGMGNFTGSREVTFTVYGTRTKGIFDADGNLLGDDEQVALSKASVTAIPNQIFTGEEIILKTDDGDTDPGENRRYATYANGRPVVFTLKVNGVTYEEGVDFVITGYERNDTIGTAYVYLQGLNADNVTPVMQDGLVTGITRAKDKYGREKTHSLTGERRVTFRITRASVSLAALRVTDEAGTVSSEIPAQDYTGKAWVVNGETEDAEQVRNEDASSPLQIALTYAGFQLVEGRDYTVGHEDNTQEGTATVRFTAVPGSGFTGVKTITFDIRKGEEEEEDPFDLGLPSNYINVQRFGAVPDDAYDDAPAFNAAIAALGTGDYADCDTVYVPGGTYVLDVKWYEAAITMKSNMALVMADDAILQMKANSRGDRYHAVMFKDCVNASVMGGQIVGERTGHTGGDSEWGMGIGLYRSSNITISNVNIRDHWGDGIYLSSATPYDPPNYNVVIQGCSITNNRRDNISICMADTLLIDGCYIADANGTPNQCGILIEPNRDQNDRMVPCKNITISNTTVNSYQDIRNNPAKQYLCFATVWIWRDDDKAIDAYSAEDVTIINCTFNGDSENYSAINLRVINSTINGTFGDSKGSQFINDNTAGRPALMRGIDVSAHQGVIDWAQVKASGVEFAIIRCAFRGYGTGALLEDSYYRRNIQGAINAGIKVGIYVYSSAISYAEAVEEANFAVSLASGYHLSLPIFMDVENPAEGRARNLTIATRTSLIKEFCTIVHGKGYRPGVYSNTTWYNTMINTPELAGYTIWLAQYNTQPTYTRTRYDLWQYSSKGSVPGITTNVDMNYSYINF